MYEKWQQISYDFYFYFTDIPINNCFTKHVKESAIGLHWQIHLLS